MRASAVSSRADSSFLSSASMRSQSRAINYPRTGLRTKALADRDVPTFIGTAQIYLTASPLRHALSLSNLALEDSTDRKVRSQIFISDFCTKPSLKLNHNVTRCFKKS